MPKPHVLAIVPVRGGDDEFRAGTALLAARPLLSYTLEAARQAACVERIVVSTDSPQVRQQAQALGAEVPFLRPPELCARDVSLDRVLQHCVRWLEEQEGYGADVVVLLEITHPIREPGLIDRVVETLLQNDLDSVFVAREERHSFWTSGGAGDLKRVGDEEYAPRHLRKPIYREMSGMACASRAEFVRAGSRLGHRVGLVPIRGLGALVDTHDENGLWLAERILEVSR